jgi:microcystin degradation protein MlrC
MKILVAGFQHETNTFVEQPTGHEEFARGGMFPALLRGADLLSLQSMNFATGGFIKAFRSSDCELVPVVWAGATPGGRVTRACYEDIAHEICRAAVDARPHAIYLDLHGGMVCEHLDDGEGELLSRLRSIVGIDCRIVASLDLHANVTARMLDIADGLVAYRTYPHIDMAESGSRTASLLKQQLQSGGRFATAAGRVPFLIPVTSMATDLEPARGIYAQIQQIEQTADSPIVLSFAPGFPAADFPGCGGSVWACGPDLECCNAAVTSLYSRITDHEAEWVSTLLEPRKAARLSKRLVAQSGGPVIIADVQDNPGAGGSSDSTGLLKALLQEGVPDAALGLIVDSTAAQAAHKAGVGAEITVDLGGRAGVPGDQPLHGTFLVRKISDGRCRFAGPMMHGKRSDVGPSACLAIGDVEIAVSSFIDQMLDRQLFEMVGISPDKKQVVCVKSAVHFRADFAQAAKAIILAKAPGRVAADPADLRWTKLAEGMRISPLGPSFHRTKTADARP